MYGWKCVAVSPAMSLTAIIPATVAIRLLHVYGAHTNPRLHFNSLGNWERDATCHHYVWIHKKILPLLQFALTASRFPQGGGIMELVWPYKYLLSLKFVYLAIYLHSFQKKRREGVCWSLCKDRLQVQEDEVIWPASTASTGRLIPPRNRSLMPGMRIYSCFQSLGSLQ